MSLPHSLFLVIFGASGDLTRRKLMPALVKIHNEGRFPPHFAIVGCARTAYSDETYRSYLKEELAKSPSLDEKEKASLDDFLSTVYYQSMDPADAFTYSRLNERLKALSPQYENDGNYLFYLATPPLLYELIPKYLHDAGILKKPGLKRIIVEKPFGYDLASARKLNKIYATYFKEEDIYRIDHFLGKETVQNIMVTRFGSTIYEPIWNRNYIDYVEITAVENMGIGTRGGYYDGSGALRDMVQNHLMQLLAITVMEPPAKFDKDGFRNEVIKVYQSLHPLTDEYIRENVIRGQYRNLILLRKPFRHFRQDTLHSANAENRITIKKNLLHHSSASLNDNSLRTKNLGISLRIKFRYPASIHFKPCPVKKATHRSF